MMLRKAISLAALLLSAGALSLPATAQFGPETVAAPDAAELAADRAVKESRYSEARSAYREACQQKSRQKEVWGRNCRKLADLHRQGMGGRQDYEAAKDLYDQACFGGRDAQSCMQQAYISFKGTDGTEDLTYARKLYEQACELGDSQGCAGYGSMLYRGQGGLMKRDEGKRLIQQACADGDPWACERARGFGFPDRRGL